MTILFAGGEWDAFQAPSGPNGVDTSTAFYDVDYASCAMQMTTNADFFAELNPSAQTDVWVHFEIYVRNNLSSNAVIWRLENASGQGILRGLRGSTATTAYMQYWNGSAWTTIGSAFTIANDTRVQWDIHARIADSGGIFEWYINSVLASSFSGDTNLFAGSTVSKIAFGGTFSGTNFSSLLSQVIVADVDTRAMKLATIRPNANGTTGDWTGTYADVDEVGSWSDADYISSGTANQVELFGMSNLSAQAQTLDPIAFVMTARGRKGASGPQNVQAAVRTGGTDYFSGNMTGVTTSFGNFGQIKWEVNPQTGVAWTVSEIQAIEAGFKSIT